MRAIAVPPKTYSNSAVLLDSMHRLRARAFRERIDAEIFLLSPRDAEDDEADLDRILDLLPDVPAGKLAIADLHAATREDVIALERAGVDAVLVDTKKIAHLVGGAPPEV